VASPSGDVVAVQLKFTSGATGYLNAILATPFFMRFHVFGSQGWVESRDTVHPQERGVTWLTMRKKGGEPQIREYHSIDTVLANLEAFALAVAGEAPYPNTNEQKIHNIAVLEAIVASAAGDRVVKVA
jgi:predicted dehydrogenase